MSDDASVGKSELDEEMFEQLRVLLAEEVGAKETVPS
jgi:hypothetical protein